MFFGLARFESLTDFDRLSWKRGNSAERGLHPSLGLSTAAHESGNEGGPSVSELAERIKALKAAHSIEATPQRARQKHSSAEEPVTARIRRRTEALPASDPAIQTDATASRAGTLLPPDSTGQAIPEDPAPPGTPSGQANTTQDLSIKPQMAFQERLAMERRRKEDQEITL